MPADKVLSQKADSVIIITIQSSGYNKLYRNLFKSRKTVYVDMSQLKTKKNDSFFEANLLTTDLNSVIQSQLSANEKLIDIYPSAIHFRFEISFSKKVPVHLNLNISYQKQFGLYNRMYLIPDSINITGPLDQINNIKSISTIPVTLSDVKENQHINLPLIKEDEKYNISLDYTSVKLIIPVVQYTEANLEIPVVIDSIPEGYSIRTYPEKVNIVYQVALRDYKKMNTSMFVASINAKNALQTGTNKLKVELSKFPPNIKVVEIDPDRVEYIFFK